MGSVKAEVLREAHCARQIYDQHCHTKYELLFVLNGSIRLNLEGEQLLLGENSGIVIEPMKYHVVTGNNTPYHRLILSFGQEAVPEPIADAFRERVRRYRRIGGSEAVSALRRYAEIVELAEPLYAPLAEALLTQAIYDLTFEKSVASGASEASGSDKIRQITAFVEENLHRELPLSDIAAGLYMSESSLCHLFREEMNISLKQYILQKKMIYARVLLKKGTSPGAVASMCGYHSYASFYKIFVKITGKTPGQIVAEPPQR